MVSPSAKWLWASSRSRTSGTPGYISAFSLSSTGAIEQQLFLTKTSTSGGSANAVAPAFFSDDFVALTDTEERFVQIWQFNGTAASAVAQLSLDDGGCCANAVWYD
jgi:carboxy-cis,cis-muconate cyclase